MLVLTFADGQTRSNSKIIIQPPLSSTYYLPHCCKIFFISYRILFSILFRKEAVHFSGKPPLGGEMQEAEVMSRFQSATGSELGGLSLALLSVCRYIGWEMGVTPPVLPSSLGLPEAE